MKLHHSTHTLLTLLLCSVFFLVTPLGIEAANANEPESPREFLDVVGGAASYHPVSENNADVALASTLGLIVRMAITTVGVIFCVYLIYGGYLWLTAAGNDDRIEQSKTIIRNGVIGLIVISMSFGAYVMATAYMNYLSRKPVRIECGLLCRTVNEMNNTVDDVKDWWYGR